MTAFLTITAAAILSLILLIASHGNFSFLSRWYSQHPLRWHRKRRQILRALAYGSLLR